MGIEFFGLLYSDHNFCEALGRATLAAARFESGLRAFLLSEGVDVPTNDATLGALVARLSRHGFLSENGVQVLRTLKFQRNYVTHSLFDLFSARIDETVLPRTDLVPEDVSLFTEKVQQLEEDLRDLSAIVEERIAALVRTKCSSRAHRLLFRP